MEYKLSYIIATRNRFPFLKITLEKLIEELQPDEEIVIVDCNSSDGTKEYLQQLFDDKKIQQFVSEPDKNQAHGWNKALLMAKGTLIKKIIDDDVYSYKAIRACKNFMLQNPAIDLCISNFLTTVLSNSEPLRIQSDLHHFNNWKEGKIKAFPFSDVHILIRNSSLSFLGLFDIQFKMMDMEYSLRASFLKANIVHYSGYNSFSVYTPGSVTATSLAKEHKFEEKIVNFKYSYNPNYNVSFYSHFKVFLGRTYRKLFLQKKQKQVLGPLESYDLQKNYTEYYKILNDRYSEKHTFNQI